MLLGATQVLPLLLETSYLVIDAPPLFAGTVHVNLTFPSPGVAVKFRGAVGCTAGTVLQGESELVNQPFQYGVVQRAMFAL